MQMLAAVEAEYQTLLSNPNVPSWDERRRRLQRLPDQMRQFVYTLKAAAGKTAGNSEGTETSPTAEADNEALGPTPHSLLQVDQLRDHLDEWTARRDAAASRVSALEQEMHQAIAIGQKAEEELRLRNEQFDRLKSSRKPEDTLDALGALEVAKLVVLSAELQIAQSEFVIKPVRAELAQLQRQLEPQRQWVDIARRNPQFSREDLAELEKDIEQRASLVDVEVERALRRAALLKDSDGAENLGLTSGDVARATQGEVMALRQLAAAIRGEADVWAIRARSLPGGLRGLEREEARRQINAALQQVKIRRASVDEQWKVVRLKVNHWDQRLLALGQDTPRAKKVLEAVIRAQSSEADALERLLQRLDRVQVLLTRSLGDLDRSGSADGPQFFDWQQRLARLASLLQRAWEYELFNVVDTVQTGAGPVSVQYGVTVGKSLGALLLALVGIALASRLSRRLVAALQRRMGLSAQLAKVLTRWLQSLLIVVVLLLVLRMARVPLAAFAFMGGALAIGIGFGTQNIIKNLISGIVILLERKVRVGDVVTIGGISGEVISVDLRATTVRGFDGIESIVPNSNLLEQQVNNWTSGQPLVRRTLALHVAAGTNMERAKELVLACAQNHPLVLQDPAPEVLLDRLDASGVGLKLYYWLRLGAGRNGLQLDSDLLATIGQQLQHAGVQLAFPEAKVLLAPGHGQHSQSLHMGLGQT